MFALIASGPNDFIITANNVKQPLIVQIRKPSKKNKIKLEENFFFVPLIVKVIMRDQIRDQIYIFICSDTADNKNQHV